MAKILILASGTMGDILPYIALGQRLQQEGYQIQMVSPKYIHPQIKSAGLLAIAGTHQKVNPKTAKESSLLWDSWTRDPRNIAVKRKLNQEYHGQEKWRSIYQSINELLAYFDFLDGVICNPQENTVGAIIAEKFAVPLIQLVVTPQLIYQPNNWWQQFRQAKLKDNPKDTYQKFRHFLGLTDSQAWKQYWQSDRLIFAASPSLYATAPELPTAKHVGFFFYNHPDWKQWQPSPELKQFVESDTPPLVLSFSSQPMSNGNDFISIHARAAKILGRKILIQRGWAGLDKKDLPTDVSPDTVMFIDFIPQAWLFSRSAAIITHGGIGTVARALLCGCPLLVEPNTHEQCFNAHRVLLWQVGAAVHPKKITPEGIARVLEQKVLTSECKQAAVKIQAQLQQEQGLENAVTALKSWLRPAAIA